MKKLFFMIAALLFAVSAMAGTPSTQDFGENTPIIITPKPPFPPTPRSIGVIACMYSSGKIETTFFKNIGEVLIIVVNHSTGEQWTDYADTSMGSWDTYISGNPGKYSITLGTESGAQYSGEFSL